MEQLAGSVFPMYLYHFKRTNSLSAADRNLNWIDAKTFRCLQKHSIGFGLNWAAGSIVLNHKKYVLY